MKSPIINTKTGGGGTTKKGLTMDTKVTLTSSKPNIANQRSQPIRGKLGDGMSSMPGSSGLGQMVKTAPSNPIQGKPTSSGTAMGSGDVINPFV